MSGLLHCCQLQNVNLSENTLRNCLENLIPKSSHGYTCLRNLNLSDSKLNNVDVQNLQRVLKGSKLDHLFLSDNNLSGCLQLLYEIDISALTTLILSRCKLNKTDMVRLSRRQMSKLKILQLSENTLTNCLSDLLWENTSLASLSHLYLKHCKLSSEDVTVLGHAGLNGKLPNIGYLDVWKYPHKPHKRFAWCRRNILFSKVVYSSHGQHQVEQR